MKTNCMQLTQTSSLQKHFLYSVIPQEFKLYHQPQIKKTIDFYKPEQCIWNNPHRTSNKLYKFFHKDNDKYRNTKEKQIKILQSKDRQLQQINRIRNFTQKRDQTRIKFYSKMYQNRKLQQKCGNKWTKNASSQCLTQKFGSSLYEQFDKFNKIPSKSFKQQFQTSNNFNFKSQGRRKSYKKLISTNEQTFLDSVRKCERQKQKLINIVKVHKKNMYKKLRQEFTRQKQQNWKKNENILSSQHKKLEFIR